MPPRAQRPDEIEALATYYIRHYAGQLCKTFERLEAEELHWLEDYPWRGNVPELKSAARHMVHLMANDGVIGTRQLRQKITIAAGDDAPQRSILSVQELEQRESQRELSAFGTGKKGKQKAAEALGISVATLYRKMEQYQFEKKEVNIRNELE